MVKSTAEPKLITVNLELQDERKLSLVFPIKSWEELKVYSPELEALFKDWATDDESDISEAN